MIWRNLLAGRTKWLVLFLVALFATEEVASGQDARGFRGVWNSWGYNAMSLDLNVWRTTVQATGSDHRFKIAHDNWDYEWTHGGSIALASVEDAFTGGGNTEIAATAGRYYTVAMNNVDSEQQGRMIVQETENLPIDITAVSHSFSGRDAVISITSSATPSPGEKIYVRYTMDGWSSSDFVVATGSGTAWSATIEHGEADESESVSYFVLTTTVATPTSSDANLQTIRWNNNGGPNYDYVVPEVSGPPVGAPSVQASDLQFSAVGPTSVTLSWSNGDGERRLVFAREGGPVSFTPQDGVWYDRDEAFGTSTEYGDGNYSVYMGSDSSVSVTGLDPETAYHFQVFEFNGNGTERVYNVSTAANNPLPITTAAVGAIQLFINEIMASNNATIQDEDGDYPDWVELYNAGSEPINLLGWGLSDNESNPFKWVFGDATIDAGEYLIIWASRKDRTNAPHLHTSWALSASGEEVLLTMPDGTEVDFIDPIAIPTDISYGRQPDGSANLFFFEDPTPGASNTTEGFGPNLTAPIFSVDGGFFTDPVTVELSTDVDGGVIRYTLDGSEPSESSPVFSSPLTLASRAGTANDISEIPTNNAEPFDDFREGWRLPDGEVFKLHTVRARVFKEGSLPGPDVTQSYLIDAAAVNRYNLPVVSIATDRDNLFDNEIGIYVPGNNQNYFQRGSEWERPGTIEFFEADGTLAFNQSIGIRLHGNTTRSRPRKTLRIYARPGSFEYQLFPDKEIATFDTFLLRNSGNDWGEAVVRDMFMQSLAENTELDRQFGRPVIVFINGEYWGIHGLRDRFDDGYIENHYGLAEDEFTQLEIDYQADSSGIPAFDRGNPNLVSDYMDLRSFIDTNGVVSTTDYQHVRDRMDIANFIDFYQAHIFFGNTDWPGNNVRIWRSVPTNRFEGALNRHDGRWRHMLFDTDFGFGLNFLYVPGNENYQGNNASFGEFAQHNTLAFAASPTATSFSNAENATMMFRRFLENDDFRESFVQRFSDQLNTAYSQAHVTNRWAEFVNLVDPEMSEHIARWRQPFNWSGEKNRILSYAEARTDAVWGHLQSFFNLGPRHDLTVEVANSSEGHVRVNSIDLNSETAGFFGYPWTGNYFRDYDVNLTAVASAGYQFVEWVATTSSVTTVAADDADNYGSWNNNSEGGFGFGSWDLQTTSGDSSQNGHFLASGSPNHWGLYANSGNAANAYRSFATPLAVGETFTTQLRHGDIQTAGPAGSVGVQLRNSAGDELWTFSFQGGDSEYVINGADTGIGFTTANITIELTPTGGNDWSAVITTGGTSHTFAGSFANSGSVSQFRAFNFNAGPENNLLVQNLSVTSSTAGSSSTYSTDPSITVSLSGDSEFEAIFEVDDAPQPELIHYWNFNEPGTQLTPSYSLVNGAGMDIDLGPLTVVTSGTGQDFAGANAQFGDEAGAHLRINDPIGATNNIAIPTTGFEDIVVQYETRRSGSGAGLQHIDYTLDGANYTHFQSIGITEMPVVQLLDFSSVSGANENPNFGIQITFEESGGGTAGNNRFDNLTVEGVPTGVVNLPPVLDTPIEHQELIAQGAVATIDLNGVFSDPEDDPLTFGAQSGNEEVATVSLAGSLLTVTPVARGGSTITVTADDGNNPEVTSSFYVLVYPEAHDLGAEAYTFTEWSATNAAGAFPPHMLFLQSEEDDTEIDTDLLFAYHIPPEDAREPEDVDAPYAASRRTRINGLGEDGMAFINTGRGRDLGGALLALDTRTVSVVPVSWLGGTVEANNREYAIRLQYRVGASGPWTDVLDSNSDPVVYERNVDGHSEVLGPVLLPAEALDEEYVQLLWRYYWADPEGVTGSRAQLRIGDVEVANTAAAPAEELEFAVEPPNAWQSGVTLSAISVQAVDGEGQVDLNFDGQITISLQGDGSLSGSTQVTAVDGVAIFDALTITGTGSAQLQATASGVDPALSGSVALADVTGVVVPQFMQGEQDVFGDNNDRVPFAFRAELEGLLPNATYRYGNRVVVPAAPATDNGAGNMIFVTGDSSDWIRNTSSPRFRDTDFEDRHYEFTTDSNGSYTGWFVTEPSGNASFTPGNTVRLRIMLNDGQGGEDPVWYLTLADEVSVIRFGEAINEASAIMGGAADPARNFVFLYDNTSGSGRPLAGAPIEITGSDVDDRYAGYYETIVAVSEDFWGTLIPNNLSNGVRRIETRALTTGAVMTADEFPSGADDTVNPSSGLDPITIGAVNLPPVVVVPVGLQTTIAGADTFPISMTSLFEDPEDDPLTFGASSDSLAVATVSVDGDNVNVTPVSQGQAIITVTADDGVNAPVSTSFRVLVYPAAHVLENGRYEFDEWAATNAANAFPANMIFLQSDRDDTEIDTELLFAYHIPADDAGNAIDVDFPYNASSRTRLNGLGEDGIAFINTGRGRDLGGALLALDTRNVTEAPVAWLGGTVLANNREYAIRLQYRVGSIGPWLDVLDDSEQPVEYSRNATDGHTQAMGPVELPAAALGEEYVQLLWRYYWTDPAGTTGSRAQLRLDDIVAANSAVLPASALAFEAEPVAFWQSGQPLLPMTVHAVDANGLVDTEFDDTITLAAVGDAALTGDLSIQAVDGVATFTNVVLTGLGTNRLSATSGNLAAAQSDEIALSDVTGILVPQFMQGEQDASDNNEDRIPYAFRAQIDGLLPNATYRYGNRVITPDDPWDQNGAGNSIFVTGSASDWIRNTSSPRFRDTDFESRHYQFTTDGSGSYTGWFVTEPSGNARFTPGNTVQLRILLNDGQDGEDEQHYLTLAEEVTVIRFGDQQNEATGIMGESAEATRNFVFLYDDTTGSGRPLASAPIEITGSEIDDRYAIFYEQVVATSPQFWGTLIPNTLPTGVRRIEARSVIDGSILSSDTFASGIPETIDPDGGLNAILLDAGTDVPVFLPGGDGLWDLDANWSTGVYPNGVDAEAQINESIGDDRDVDIESPVTIGHLTIDNAASEDRNRVRGRDTNVLTFAASSGPAQLSIKGSGSGFVEFRTQSSIVLASDLLITITNLNMDHGLEGVLDDDYGALRFRDDWMGPGGLIKQGAGVMTMTGGGKDYTGPTIVDFGVLRITEPATPEFTSGVTVNPGGQLRLVSDGDRVYPFGGTLTLNGMGRGGDVPVGENLGILGALRYDPGSNDNRAKITNSVVIADATSLHVDGTRNVLDLSGPISGPGLISKSGGGTLVLSGDSAGYTAPVIVSNGVLQVDGVLGAPVSLESDGVVSGAGSVGALSGSGTVAPGSGTEALTAPSVSGLNYRFTFTETEASILRLTDATPFVGNLNAASTIELFFDVETLDASSVFEGGFFTDEAADFFTAIEKATWTVYVRDESGSVEHEGETYSLYSESLALSTVTATIDFGAGPVSGRILQIGEAEAPAGFAAWQDQEFTAAEVADPAISGPLADPDDSGIPNLLRYALGLGRTDAFADALPVGQVEPPIGVYRHRRLLDEESGISYVLWVSEELDSESWLEVVFGTDLIEIDTLATGDGITEIVEYEVPASTLEGTARYFRLQVVLDEEE